MLIIAVMDVGQAFKPGCKRFTHSPFALETRTPRPASSRHLQNTIVRKECHDAIKIVRVEGFAYLPQRGPNVHSDLQSKVVRVDMLRASDFRNGLFADSPAQDGTSASPLKADITGRERDVRYGP